jgi:hypothetical protein
MMNARTNASEIGIAIVCMATPKGPKQSGRTPVTPKELFKRVVSGSREPRKTPIPAFNTTMPTMTLIVPSRTSRLERFCRSRPTSAITPRKIGA